ncbi:putative oxidoreductase YhhX [compost metagenome]
MDEDGVEHNERVPSEVTDYGLLYEDLEQAIRHGAEKPVKDEEVLYVLKVLEDGVEAARQVQ